MYNSPTLYKTINYQSFLKAVFAVLLVSLFLASAKAQLADRKAMLADPEWSRVMRDIDRLVKTPAEEMPRFSADTLTRERQKELLNSTYWQHLTRSERKNLIALGAEWGDFYRLPQVSDALTLIERWFPDELASARKEERPRLYNDLLIPGPYINSDPKSAAFLVLWQCAPQSIWLRPDQSAFELPVYNDTTSTSLRPINHLTISKDHNDIYEFGHCVRERAGYIGFKDELSVSKHREQLRPLVQGVSKSLRALFLRTIERNACTKTGPDDCVLVFHLWSSLGEGQERMLPVMEKLEPEIVDFQNLPPLLAPKETAYNEWKFEDGQRRYSDLLRISAFLRAKLRRILDEYSMDRMGQYSFGANHQATVNTLQETLRSMIKLAGEYNNTYVNRYQRVQIPYYNEAVNPWAIVQTEYARNLSLQQALIKSLNEVQDQSCKDLAIWTKHSTPALPFLLLLNRLENGQTPRCLQISREAIHEVQASLSNELPRFARLLSHLSSQERERFLAAYMGNGDPCLGRGKTQLASLDKTICRQWASKPQNVSQAWMYKLFKSGKATRFHSSKLTRKVDLDAEADAENLATQTKWFLSLGDQTNKQQLADLSGIEEKLKQDGLLLTGIRQFKHPQGRQRLIEIQFSDRLKNANMPYSATHWYLWLHQQGASLVGTPTRFTYQYDDGVTLAVSDIDQDGNPEIWLKGEFGECDGPGSRPNHDCAFSTIHMGEIDNNIVSYFRKKIESNKVKHIIQQSKLLPY